MDFTEHVLGNLIILHLFIYLWAKNICSFQEYINFQSYIPFQISYSVKSLGVELKYGFLVWSTYLGET